jgi:hypothetical protein
MEDHSGSFGKLDELFQGKDRFYSDFTGPIVNPSVFKYMVANSYWKYNPKIKSLRHLFNAYRLNSLVNGDSPEKATRLLFDICDGSPVAMFDYLGDWLAKSMDMVTASVLSHYKDMPCGIVTRDAQYISKPLDALRLNGIIIDKSISNMKPEDGEELRGVPVSVAIGVEWDGHPIMTGQDKLKAGKAMITRPEKGVYLYDTDPVEPPLVEWFEGKGGLAIEITRLHEIMGMPPVNRFSR